MLDTAALAMQLTQDEGERLVVYDDATGQPLKRGDTLRGHATIGVGRNLHRGLSRSESQMLLRNDIATTLHDLDTALPWWKMLSPTRQAVLANMCFNLGLPTLLTFKVFLQCLAVGDYGGASAAMLNSIWATQVGARAERLASALRAGEAPAGAGLGR